MALTSISTGGIKDAQVTAGKLHADALDRTYTLGASGNDHYTFTGEGLIGAVNDPTLYLTRGKTYRFVNGNSSGAHPFRIQSVAGAGGTEYNTGVTNNAGAGGSTIIFEVQHDAPDVLYYQCTSHANMGGTLYITGALADGGVTTAKIADGAVTDVKIANSAVTTTKIADDAVDSQKLSAGAVDNIALSNNAVTTAKIADEAVTLAKLPHGTSSNDGKFLRANNGADPTFESLPSSGATLTGSTNNTVVTVTGANAMQGESNVTIDSSGRLLIGTTTEGHDAGDEITVANTGHAGITIRSGTTSRGALYFSDGTSGTDEYRGAVNYDHTDNYLRFYTNGTETVRFIAGGGITFNADTAAANALDDYEEGTYTPTFTHGFDPSPSYAIQAGFYTKVGRLVNFNFYLQLASGSQDTDGGRIKVSLPFNQMSSTYVRGHGAVTYTNIASAYPSTDLPSLYIYGNNAEAYSSNGSSYTGGNGSNQASRYFIGGGSYYSAT